MDVSDPAAPRGLGSAPTLCWDAVELAGGRAFVMHHSSGEGWDRMQIFDVNDPASPHLTGCLAGRYFDAAASGEFAYALADHGFHAVRLGPNHTDLITSRVDGIYQAGQVLVAGSLALVTSASPGRLVVVDISNPSAPLVRGQCSTGTILFLASGGGYAYAVSGSQFMVIDVSNPASPGVTGSLPYSAVGGLAASGDRVYLTSQGDLHALDVSDPGNPVLATTRDLRAYGGRIALGGGYAFVACSSPPSLQVVDIHDPANPVLSGHASLAATATDIDLSGGYAFVLEDGPTLQVIDFSDPTNPSVVAGIAPGGHAYSCRGSIQGTFLYLTDGTSGTNTFRVVDIADPEAPRLVALPASFAPLYSYVNDVGAADEGVWLTLDGSLYLVPRQCDAATGVPAMASSPGPVPAVRVSPVPSAGPTTIRLADAGAGPTTAEVFDVHGRAVTRLEAGHGSAAAHELVWDGRDSAGRDAPSGIYFVRLSGTGGGAVARVVLLR